MLIKSKNSKSFNRPTMTQYSPIYPTSKDVFDRYLELASDNDDIDDAVYEVICEWDEQFADDTTWCNDEENDMKDRLRDEVLEMLNQKKEMTPTATIMKEIIDEWSICAQGSPFEVEQWGWRYWRMLEDTPYTQGEHDLAGWNSHKDNMKGKQAFKSFEEG